jgi:hypothetical protein
MREDVIEKSIEELLDIVENYYDHSHFFDILMERHDIEAKSTEDKQRLFYMLSDLKKSNK